jgi:uncharacterized membrane protein
MTIKQRSSDRMSFLDILTFTAMLGSSLVAGIFFAFSNFIMRALGQLPENQGIAAMKAINVTVLNPWFFLAFFGTGVVCLPVAFLAFGSAVGTHRAYLLAACVLYLLGCLLVTLAFNVPLNNRLASVEPCGSGTEAVWTHYLSRWTLWNSIRTAASLVAAGLFGMALWDGLTS